jgi:aminopeptidase N
LLLIFYQQTNGPFVVLYLVSFEKADLPISLFLIHSEQTMAKYTSDIPQVIYRNQYTPPPYLIDTVDLNIDLTETNTTIQSTFQIRKNPEIDESNIPLLLNGENQVLQSIQINHQMLSEKDYQLDENKLILTAVPNHFQLVITTTTQPQLNTKLMGLYKSNQMFCTQCEPEGFRRMTYFIDRPDILSRYTTTITADKTRYPILLSNGNRIEYVTLPDNRHRVTWQDPFKKPCYLFAVVAGDFDVLEDYFVTCSGRRITLKIFSDKGYKDKCRFAMQALKKAMHWDETTYNREYDLDNFMIVAVNDFNQGAMENKGLNIFNAKYIYVDPKIATDENHRYVEEVVAHEYFHNWSGNRVTCRDWFQLSLKEGFTVFREQNFSEDINSHGVIRIKQVDDLRHTQFLEDAGPLAHPVRPDSYMEIDNFYTATVYEKGAEVIRMLRSLLGTTTFRKGANLYFKRHDGQAVTCDDFVQAMQDVSGIDLNQFKLWYSQAGTPHLTITDQYHASKKTYQFTVQQTTPPTPNQPEKKPFHIPLTFGLLDQTGQPLPIKLKTKEKLHQKDVHTLTLFIKQSKETFTVEQVDSPPIPSWLRDFSAPVKLNYTYTDEMLAILAMHDTDAFARFEAMQTYLRRHLFTLISQHQKKEALQIDPFLLSVFKTLLNAEEKDLALKSLMLELPTEIYLSQFMETIDVDAIHFVRDFVKQTLANHLTNDFESLYHQNETKAPYQYTAKDAAKRALKSTCLYYLTSLNTEKMRELATHQFNNADNMTDQFYALLALSRLECSERETALSRFYTQWEKEPLVIDKWFAAQALSPLPSTLARVTQLLDHPAFTLKTPNRVYSLLVTFARSNPICFHDITGAAYELIADQILKIDPLNAPVASKLAKAFTQWRRFNARLTSVQNVEQICLT